MGPRNTLQTGRSVVANIRTLSQNVLKHLGGGIMWSEGYVNLFSSAKLQLAGQVERTNDMQLKPQGSLNLRPKL